MKGMAVVNRRVGLRIFPILAATLWLAGCSMFSGGYDAEYRDAQGRPPLDVPPDLTTPQWGRSMSVPGEPEGRVSAVEESQKAGQAADQRYGSGPEVLPEFEDVQVQRDGNTRWLTVQATPTQLWPRLRGFWREQGIPLVKDDPALGLMVSDWYDHRDALPRTGVRGMLSRVTRYFADQGIRDKYRLRVERTEGGDRASNVYMTVQRAAQTADAPAGDDTYDESTLTWALMPSDPELDAEMLTKLMVFLGATEEEARLEVASAPDQSINVEIQTLGGRPVMVVDDRFSNVWRLTGVALDRSGLYVEQQDRTTGTFYFTYTDEGQPKQSFLGRLFSGSGDLEVNKVYELHLRDDGPRTLVTVHNSGEDADTPIDAEDAQRLLNRVMNSYRLGG